MYLIPSGKKPSILSLFLVCGAVIQMFSCATPGRERVSWLGPAPAEPISGFKFVRSFGSTGNGPGQLLHPRGISLDPSGFVYIADTGNHRIQKFDPDGRFLKEIGGFGWEPGRFSSPTGLTAREGLNIYVADSQNRRIQRFDRDLNYLSSIPFSDEEDPAFGFLWDVEVASTGELFVSDAENEQIWKLTPFGQTDRAFGGFGSARERLRSPAAVTLGADNRIYVCDPGNDRVVCYDTFGAFMLSLGDEHLRAPQGLIQDRAGYLYVADTGGDRLCVFDPQGELLISLNGTGEGPGSMRSPMDVAISNQDRIYVLDSGNDRVQVFAILRPGEPPER
jgi:DNA-binding beta-propeller fold protein YncE